MKDLIKLFLEGETVLHYSINSQVRDMNVMEAKNIMQYIEKHVKYERGEFRNDKNDGRLIFAFGDTINLRGYRAKAILIDEYRPRGKFLSREDYDRLNSIKR